jgi:REP element-mobilizing transposase RayT
MSTGYHIDEPEGLYYVTLQVIDWIDVFTRPVYKEILVENLAYCQKYKGLNLFAYVVMSNHVHLLGSQEATGVKTAKSETFAEQETDYD